MRKLEAEVKLLRIPGVVSVEFTPSKEVVVVAYRVADVSEIRDAMEIGVHFCVVDTQGVQLYSTHDGDGDES